jgi:hypothetical protein
MLKVLNGSLFKFRMSFRFVEIKWMQLRINLS